jgi:Spy/CpxP family protein refolding chaperone
MTRKHGALVLIGFLGAILLASAVQAQDQAPPPGRRGMRGMMGGPGGPGMGSMGLLFLLRSEKVQKELQLTDNQKTKLEDADGEFREQMRDLFPSLQDLSDEERRTKMNEFQEKVEKKLGEILEPKQLERLDQIQLQVQGPMALTTPKVSKALEITDEQKEKIQSKLEEMQTKMGELFGSLRDLSPEERREKMPEMRDKMQQISKETGDQMLVLLTPEQRDKFDKMKGEKFESDLRDLFPRGPRGGGPPGGGPGGPPPQ